MGIADETALAMTFHDYQAALWHWNEVHSDGADAPDADMAMAILEKANADPRLIN